MKVLDIQEESDRVKFFIIIDSLCNGNMFMERAPDYDLLPHTVMMKSLI
jgi:hypothetical protein